MNPVLATIAWLLAPASLLPVLTAWILRPYRDADSPSLRDRWHLSVILALLGLLAAVVAVAALLGASAGWLWIPFGLALLLTDLASGKWLLDYWRGRFR
jgi:hypothetical protein